MFPSITEHSSKLQLGNKIKTPCLTKHAQLNQKKVKGEIALAKWTRDVTKNYWERGLPDKNKNRTRTEPEKVPAHWEY